MNNKYYLLVGFMIGVLVCVIVFSVSQQDLFEPAFDLCVETYEESIFVNTLFYSQINNLTFNANQTKQDIIVSDIRQQFLDKVVED